MKLSKQEKIEIEKSMSKFVNKCEKSTAFRIKVGLAAHIMGYPKALKTLADITEKSIEHRNENIKLQSRIEALESEIVRLVGALKFYADKETYGCEDKSRTTGNQVCDVVCFDFSRNLEPGVDYAGKRARETIQSCPLSTKLAENNKGE